MCSNPDKSVANIARKMYVDGYDMRHMISMGIPIAVKSLIVERYLTLTGAGIEPYLSVAEKKETN